MCHTSTVPVGNPDKYSGILVVIILFSTICILEDFTNEKLKVLGNLHTLKNRIHVDIIDYFDELNFFFNKLPNNL